MARGNVIIVSAHPDGLFMEGYIASGQTPKPGTVMQCDPTVALRGGRHTWKIYDRSSDGDEPAGPLAILLNDYLQGVPVTTAYAAGDRCFLYVPKKGEEFNMIVLDVVGTADIAAGTRLSVDDGTGKLVAATGSSAPFQLLETLTAPAADALSWVHFGGF